MHILIASAYLPWPLIEGGRVAQYRTFEALRDACTFTLVVPAHNLEDEADAQLFAEKFKNVTVEAVRCFHVPPTISGRARLRRATGRFLRNIFPVPGQPLPVQAPQNFSHASPYYPFNCLNPDFVAAVEKHFSKGCDIFQAEFADMLTLGPLMAGRAPSLFVHHQLHFVYARRFLAAHGIASANARYLTERMIQEESTYLSLFDRVIVFSEVDRQALYRLCPQIAVSVSPFPSPEEPLAIALPFNQAVKQFVFVASESHRPNVDGLRWFMKDVWPTVKSRLPDAIIQVIGKWSQSARTGLPNHEDIQFAGFVPALGKALQNKIMVVPVWVGSGIRSKILAAWGASSPVVTTTVGVEGLPGEPGEHFLVADDVASFARACIELSQDISKLSRIAANGLDLVQKHYSLEAVRKTRLEGYARLLSTPCRSKL